jgi:hypothetical protein
MLKKVDGRDVMYFPFMEQLRDLLRSSTFDNLDNLCVNEELEDCFKPFQPSTDQDVGEIMANQWARESINNLDDFDAEHDFFIGIIIYGDKTGTDVNQRYPLEPWMFTLAVLR